MQAPLSCVSGALFSALWVLSPLHLKPTVYKHAGGGEIISPQQAFMWADKLQAKYESGLKKKKGSFQHALAQVLAWWKRIKG